MKYYLCFWYDDGASSESHSAYYSHLVKARTKDEAIRKYFESEYNTWATDDINDFDAVEMKNIIE